ncbi:MAG: LacI family DNA-binding transcriptional regulator [Proteobacteria bacterium]|nr:LacI family DNA-binding transcriptional regulator [Pseudomonadota bacterium]
MANIRDVAKAAGVSIASVSAALNDTGRVGEETRARIWAAVEAVGYSPNTIARSLRLGRSQLIGMVVGDITNPFSASMVRIVEKVAIDRGYSVIVCNIDGDEERVPAILDQLGGQNVAGILLTPIGPRARLLEQIEARVRQPLVTVDQRLPGLRRDYVGIDNRWAMRMLVDYLLRFGHRRIALISGRAGRWTADERYHGFVEAMQEAGLEADPALCVRADYDGEGAYAATTRLLTQRERPTAIIGANNLIALRILQSLIDLGFQCPADVSLVGMDDVPWSGLVRPRITIVAQPIEEIGRVAIEWLLERIEGADRSIEPREKIFRPFFVAGESCRHLRIDADTAPEMEHAVST